MPTLASPLRAGVASPLLWPTARRSASSIWTTTPWVRLKKTPLDSHYPMPIQEPGTISCHGDSHSREGQIEGGLGGNRGTTCVDDQLDNQQVSQRIHHHPRARLAVCIHSQITMLPSWPSTNCQHFRAWGRDLRLIGQWGSCQSGGISSPVHELR